jgi:hypothetical protein
VTPPKSQLTLIEEQTMRFLLLLLLGIPIPIIILIALFT